MICPFEYDPAEKCIECSLQGQFNSSACGINRAVDVAKFCAFTGKQSFVRIINVHIAINNASMVSIHTSVASKIRILFEGIQNELQMFECQKTQRICDIG